MGGCAKKGKEGKKEVEYREGMMYSGGIVSVNSKVGLGSPLQQTKGEGRLEGRKEERVCMCV